MSVKKAIEEKLEQKFSPTFLEVIDESHHHAGHAGASPDGETHFRVTIVSEYFAGKSRLDRQRLVYALLAEELAGPVHALSIDARVQET